MSEFFLKINGASTMVDVGAVPSSGVRVYKSSPETVALQIRTCGPVAPSGYGKSRVSYSHVSLTAQDIDALVTQLLHAANALSTVKGV